MYPNYFYDRKALGYEIYEDTQCGIRLVKLSDRVFLEIQSIPCNVGKGKQKIKKTFGILVCGVSLFLVNPEPAKAVGTNPIPNQIERLSKANLYREIKPKVRVRNEKWLNDLIVSIRGGGDDKLIESILSKVPESYLDLPSINKILKELGELTLEIGSNDKLMRVLAELERPFKPGLVKVSPTPSNDILGLAKNLEAKQSSSSILVEGFIPKLPRHRNRNQVEWKKENKCSTPTAEHLLDPTKCYGHREAYNMPRSVTERFESNAVRKLAKNSLKNPNLKNEYKAVKDLLKKGIHPVNIGKKSTFVSPTKVLVKKPEGRYLVDVSDTNAEIVGVSPRTNKKFISKFETLMNKLYNLDLKGY